MERETLLYFLESNFKSAAIHGIMFQDKPFNIMGFSFDICFQINFLLKYIDIYVLVSSWKNTETKVPVKLEQFPHRIFPQYPTKPSTIAWKFIKLTTKCQCRQWQSPPEGVLRPASTSLRSRKLQESCKTLIIRIYSTTLWILGEKMKNLEPLNAFKLFKLLIKYKKNSGIFSKLFLLILFLHSFSFRNWEKKFCC